MRVEFHPSVTTSLGVEVEVGIVDLATEGLAGRASDVLAVLGEGHPGGVHPTVKHELYECSLELVTGVCPTVAAARADLERSLAQVRPVLAERGLGLLATGVHPFASYHDLVRSPGERYEDLVSRIGWPARRLMTHGVHVHVGVRSGPRALAITGALTGVLPVFLALSASSPYWHGRDTGLASVRTKVFEALPTTGLPPRLTGWDQFERLMGTLVTAGSIRTIREVWWDVRPHPDFGTVELRMCDGAATLSEVAALAALGQSFVEQCERRLDAGEPLPVPAEWVLRENKWRACRWGLQARLVVDDDGRTAPVEQVAAGLVADLAPVAAELGCDGELAGVLDILEHGASYDRQRSVVAAGATLPELVGVLRDEWATDVVHRG